MVSLLSDHTTALQAGIRFFSKSSRTSLSDALLCLENPYNKKLYYVTYTHYFQIKPCLLLLEGEKGYSVAHHLLLKTLTDRLFFSSCTMFLLFAAKDFNDTPVWYRRYLRKYLGVVATKQTPIPVLMVHKNFGPSKPPLKREAGTAARFLDGINTLLEDEDFEPIPYAQKQPVPRFRLNSGDIAPEQPVEPSLLSLHPAPVSADPMEVKRFSTIQTRNTTFYLSYFLSPKRCCHKENTILLIYDKHEATLLNGEPILGQNLDKVRTVLTDCFQGYNILDRPGLPSAVKTDSYYLFQGFKDFFRSLAIPFRFSPVIKELNYLRERFSFHLGASTRNNHPIQQ